MVVLLNEDGFSHGCNKRNLLVWSFSTYFSIFSQRLSWNYEIEQIAHMIERWLKRGNTWKWNPMKGMFSTVSIIFVCRSSVEASYMCCKVIKSYWWNWWNKQIWHLYIPACIICSSEGVNQRCLYHVLLICLPVSRNTRMSVFISVPSQAPLEGQVIAFWLHLFPSAFHFRYLLQENITWKYTSPLLLSKFDWLIFK